MILSELRDYLKGRGRVTLTDMANRFDTDPDALRGMLAKWIAKGRVVRVEGPGGCAQACNTCDVAGVELYEWRG